MKAQNKFSRIIRTVLRDKLIALDNKDKSEVINVIMATSMAISVPLPIAMLTSARARA